jgi:hypothetical protein
MPNFPDRLLVHLRYPDPLHVVLPSGYLLAPKGRRASIRLSRHYVTLQLTDFTNHMIPMEGSSHNFTLHHEISAVYKDARHYSIGVTNKEDLELITKELQDSGRTNSYIPHVVTFDEREEGLYRAFGARFATDVLISYEI